MGWVLLPLRKDHANASSAFGLAAALLGLCFIWPASGGANAAGASHPKFTIVEVVDISDDMAGASRVSRALGTVLRLDDRSAIIGTSERIFHKPADTETPLTGLRIERDGQSLGEVVAINPTGEDWPVRLLHVRLNLPAAEHLEAVAPAPAIGLCLRPSAQVYAATSVKSSLRGQIESSVDERGRFNVALQDRPVPPLSGLLGGTVVSAECGWLGMVVAIGGSPEQAGGAGHNHLSVLAADLVAERVAAADGLLAPSNAEGKVETAQSDIGRSLERRAERGDEASAAVRDLAASDVIDHEGACPAPDAPVRFVRGSNETMWIVRARRQTNGSFELQHDRLPNEGSLLAVIETKGGSPFAFVSSRLRQNDTWTLRVYCRATGRLYDVTRQKIEGLSVFAEVSDEQPGKTLAVLVAPSRVALWHPVTDLSGVDDGGSRGETHVVQVGEPVVALALARNGNGEDVLATMHRSGHLALRWSSGLGAGVQIGGIDVYSEAITYDDEPVDLLSAGHAVFVVSRRRVAAVSLDDQPSTTELLNLSESGLVELMNFDLFPTPSGERYILAVLLKERQGDAHRYRLRLLTLDGGGGEGIDLTGVLGTGDFRSAAIFVHALDERAERLRLTVITNDAKGATLATAFAQWQRSDGSWRLPRIPDEVRRFEERIYLNEVRTLWLYGQRSRIYYFGLRVDFDVNLSG